MTLVTLESLKSIMSIKAWNTIKDEGLYATIASLGISDKHGCKVYLLKDGSNLVTQSGCYPRRLKGPLAQFEDCTTWWIRAGQWVLFVNETSII